MTPEAIFNGAIRLANAVLWTIVVVRILRTDKPIMRLVLQILVLVIVAAMWVLAFGSLVALGFLDAAIARTVVTVFAGFAAILALTIVRGKELEEPEAPTEDHSFETFRLTKDGLVPRAPFRRRPRVPQAHYQGRGDH